MVVQKFDEAVLTVLSFCAISSNFTLKGSASWRFYFPTVYEENAAGPCMN